ncbi:UvrB/UvrC motif-containing protein [Microaerobacter geothermalis]|uniref:UvrB/UvrC motif-containing protein n=1 Tax=Microaerobacter geothermalis TaxID=674972 RepID=UPI001F1EBEA0|nr:UvrB/UvrC motif-containing protein [Microaerobacter geothermalis]MCF6095191.1 UvrB/UvrC motif-containing protein [Microaerobacter geothermalis]
MICQGCGQKPATLHFTKILNGQKTEFHLCENCAREKGELLPGGSNGFSIHNLLSGLLNFEPNPSYGEATSYHQLQCKTCGLTYSQFTKGGRFGCSDCYSYFKHQLDPLFRRIHGNTSHSGKVPARSGGAIKLKRELEKLKQELQQSIAREEFERAAQLRDRIRDLEKNISQDHL